MRQRHYRGWEDHCSTGGGKKAAHSYLHAFLLAKPSSCLGRQNEHEMKQSVQMHSLAPRRRRGKLSSEKNTSGKGGGGLSFPPCIVLVW